MLSSAHRNLAPGSIIAPLTAHPLDRIPQIPPLPSPLPLFVLSHAGRTLLSIPHDTPHSADRPRSLSFSLHILQPPCALGPVSLAPSFPPDRANSLPRSMFPDSAFGPQTSPTALALYHIL